MNNINEILAKNLSYIRKYDSDLCNKIEAITELKSQIEMTYTEAQEPNLAINGIPINEQSGAQAEAERIVNSLSHNLNTSIHVVFGTGFGYLLMQTAKVSNGTTILYEPNIELLRVALEMVDFSEILNKPNVFITSSLDMLETIFYNHFSLNSKTALLASQYHKTQLKVELNELIKKLGVLQSIATSNENQKAKYGYGYLYSVLNNTPVLNACTPIAALKNVLKNIPAVIAAAGPSLSDNIETIKKYRNKFALFGVSSSLATLNKSGIIPDFVSLIERFDATNLVKDFGIEKTNLIAEPYVNKAVLGLPFKNKFISSSIENPANRIYENLFSLQNENFETKGTVAYNALFSALYLGCNPIILAGQDLAYIDGECYSKNSPMNEIKCKKDESGWSVYIRNYEKHKENLFGHKQVDDEKIQKDFQEKIDSLNEQLITIKSVTGEEIPTSHVFAMFCEYYKSFAQKHSKHVDLYNLSTKGANLENFKSANLENLVENFPNIAIDEVINSNTQKNAFDFEYIKKEITTLKMAINDIESKFPLFENTTKNLKENNINKIVLTEFKTLINETIKIQHKYTQISDLYKESTSLFQNLLQTVFQTNSSLDTESMLNICKCFEELYITGIKRLKWNIQLLERIK
ncbi:motility associated factor glycosyltransferase family protein [bacterium]|nr:motility associated factor glycosyltransferase family protein [bacterium]